MNLLFYLGPLPPALLVFQAVLFWLWLARARPRTRQFLMMGYVTSTVCAVAGLLLSIGLLVGRFWYLRPSAEICGGEVSDAPDFTYFPLQHRCFMADGSIVDLVPLPLSMAIAASMVVTVLLGAMTLALYWLPTSRTPDGPVDRLTD